MLAYILMISLQLTPVGLEDASLAKTGAENAVVSYAILYDGKQKCEEALEDLSFIVEDKNYKLLRMECASIKDKRFR